MMVPVSIRTQRGATLVIGLIMLVLLTLVVTSAFMLSTGNLKAVSNMQFRNEAGAATNKAIEQVVGSPFTNAPGEETISVDIDNDGDMDYVVEVEKPVCIRASVAAATAASSLSLGSAMKSQAYWNTIWDIDAAVNDPVTGASIRIRQGLRVLLTQAQKKLVCP